MQRYSSGSACGQDALQQLELARRAPDVLRRVAPRLCVLVVVKVQIRVVAHLPQLHLDVVEAGDFELAALHALGRKGQMGLKREVRSEQRSERQEALRPTVVPRFDLQSCGTAKQTGA